MKLTTVLSVVLAVAISDVASATTINVIANATTKTTTNNGGGSYETTINSRTNGVNHQVASFTETYSLTVGAVTFDYDLTWTGGGGDLNNFNSPTFSYGITGGANGALDTVGESITLSVSGINQTAGPATPIVFDGFTGLGVFFSSQVSDAGAITDGSSDIWSFDGALGTNPAANGDPVGTKTLGNSSDDSLYTWFGHRQFVHAQVDVSGSLPATMVYEVRAGSDTSDNNRVRLNNVGVQFTVVPEPASALLALCGIVASALCRARLS